MKEQLANIVKSARSRCWPGRLVRLGRIVSVEGKTDSGKPHKLAVCVGIGDACAEFEKLAPSEC